jgi:uncharacterized protein YjbI with pentapeptide repeats
MAMYRKVPCSVDACPNLAFAASPFCREHSPSPEEAVKQLVDRLGAEGGAINIDLSDTYLGGVDFSRMRFVGCRFRHATLSHVLFTGASFRLCFFDTASIDCCDFSGVDMDFCSLGDTNIFDCSFENSELIHVNFDGSRIRESTFSSSNLYDSRFILAQIEHSRFDDCDFKRVFFIPDRTESISTNGSNIAEAIKDLEHLYI